MSFLIIEDGKVITLSDGSLPKYFISTESGKPANPNVGDNLLCWDSGKQYSCVVANFWSLVASPVSEEYHNHLGTIDNMMVTAVTGTASATTDATNHKMDLANGITGVLGEVHFKAKRSITPNTVTFILNCTITNIAEGDGTRFTGIGLYSDYANPLASAQHITFQHNNDATWTIRIVNLSGAQDILITAPVDGDTLTIWGIKNKILFLINGVLAGTVLNYVPTVPCYPLVVILGDIDVLTARTVSIDYIGFKVMI